jgi:hypothetical protein
MVILVPLPMVFGAIMHLIHIDVGLAVAIEILAVIVAYMLRYLYL